MCRVDPVARGFGLLQVNEAYAYCLKHRDVLNSPVTRYEVKVNGGSHRDFRGIYIREASANTSSFTVQVIPRFHEDTENTLKTQFQSLVY